MNFRFESYALIMLVLDHQYAGLDSPHGPCAASFDGKINLQDEGAGDSQDDIDDLDSSVDVVEIQVADKEEAEAVTQKTVLVKKRFHPDLRTIRESPETVYTVSYIDMDEADDEIEKEAKS